MVVRRWDTATWAPIGDALAGPPTLLLPPAGAPPDPSAPSLPNASTAIAFSPDGRWIAAGDGAGSVYVWDAATGALDGQPIVAGGDVYSVAFSPDSAAIAATYVDASEPNVHDGMAGVWGVADRQLRYRVSVDDDYGVPSAVTFSPDGKLLATGGGIGQVRFWDAKTGASDGRPIFGNAGWVITLDFDPTGDTIVSAGTDGTARILDVAGRQQLGTALPGGSGNDSRAIWSPDGARVYVTLATDPAFAWDVGPDAMNTHACTVAGRTLTLDEWARYLPGRPYDPACVGIVPQPLPSVAPSVGPDASPGP
jgi:WD40 repeat protein